MIKRYCDVCEKQMTERNTPSFGVNGDRRLTATIQRNDATLKVEVLTGLNGTANKGDICTHCILDALYQLDDRPRLQGRNEVVGS